MILYNVAGSLILIKFGKWYGTPVNMQNTHLILHTAFTKMHFIMGLDVWKLGSSCNNSWRLYTSDFHFIVY
jgi:hypothetical protein